MRIKCSSSLETGDKFNIEEEEKAIGTFFDAYRRKPTCVSLLAKFLYYVFKEYNSKIKFLYFSFYCPLNFVVPFRYSFLNLEKKKRSQKHPNGNFLILMWIAF